MPEPSKPPSAIKRILIVFGTRPEAIKMAPLIHEFRRYPKDFCIEVCVTAQHRQMLDQVLHLFDLIADYDLDIMKPNQELHQMTADILIGLHKVIIKSKPDLILVHGDTTTTFVATLAAFYQKIPVGHVEAGLRTGNMYSPWPEEANRVLVSQLAQYHFAPTEGSKANLLKEGKSNDAVVVTGNTVIDALQIVLKRISADSQLKDTIRSGLVQSIREQFRPLLSDALDGKRKIILVTGHRRENFGDGMQQICAAIKEIAHNHRDVCVIYPVHLNPNVREPVQQILGGIPNVLLIQPVEYESFVYLMHASYLILTDSGGVQEEAPSLCKPVLVMRDTTERPEALAANTVKLVGTNRERIVHEIEKLLSDPDEYAKMARAINPYGDGQASHRIVDFLRNKNGY